MIDPAGSKPSSSSTPAKRHLNRGEIDHLLDGLAVGSGRTREVLDAELQVLRAADITGDEHLTFFEAAALHEIEPARQDHVDHCRFCKSMIETIYVNDVGIEDFERKVRTQIEATPPQRRRGSLAAWSLAGVSLLAASLFGSAYRHQSTELAELRRSSAEGLVATAAAVPLPAAVETPSPLAAEMVGMSSESLSHAVRPSTRLSESSQKTTTLAVTAENLRVLEEMNRRLNEELVTTRSELAASPAESAAHSPANERFREAALHVQYATWLIDGAVPSGVIDNPPFLNRTERAETTALR